MNLPPLGAPGVQELIVIFAVTAVLGLLYVFPLWVIFKRTGKSPFWSLLALIPGGLIAALFFLGFSRWTPAESQS